ncbi:hypothetical protein MRX96_021199 [Rhipicephalus microplus]
MHAADERQNSAVTIRQWMGKFEGIPNVAKRMGQCFSSTEQPVRVKPCDVQKEPDIIAGAHPLQQEAVHLLRRRWHDVCAARRRAVARKAGRTFPNNNLHELHVALQLRWLVRPGEDSPSVHFLFPLANCGHCLFDSSTMNQRVLCTTVTESLVSKGALAETCI